MVSSRCSFLVVLLIASACGLSAPRSAARTVVGVSQDQAFVAAHRVLGERSFDLESVDRARGKLVTEWRDQGMRSSRYEVTVAPAPDQAAADSDAVRVEVVALARDRAVRGWTKEYPEAQPARRLAQDIVDEAEEAVTAVKMLAAPTSEPEPERAPDPECAASTDCPPGQHCGSGRCVWECAADNECRGDEICDRRGRCVPRPPPATPPPAPAADAVEE